MIYIINIISFFFESQFISFMILNACFNEVKITPKPDHVFLKNIRLPVSM